MRKGVPSMDFNSYEKKKKINKAPAQKIQKRTSSAQKRNGEYVNHKKCSFAKLNDKRYYLQFGHPFCLKLESIKKNLRKN